MKKSTFLTALLCTLAFGISAQVTFIIDSLPDYTPPDDILYIAGDFQGWNPGDPAFALEKNENDNWEITLGTEPNGTVIHLKFTRGDWGKVEKGEFGEEIPDREFTYGNGDTVHCIVFNWADAGGSGNSTAAENVEIMDEAFYMPQLDRERRIWIYFPPDYEDSQDSYPVIYMHDGQNLFDTYTSYAGEWEVDETLNGLFDAGYFVPIVVGIDNGGVDRINEYTPWTNPQYGGGQGNLYMEFIVETLKPHIDENYRTLPSRESTAIWGSSLGGLIAHFGILKYQHVFGKAGIYSPSYWWSDSVWTFTENAGIQEDLMLYQMTGELEGGGMVANTWAMDDLLQTMGLGDEELSTKIVEGGEHNEQLWREDFEEAYLWLFHSFANSTTERYVSNMALHPNPAKHSIRFPAEIRKDARYTVFNVWGNPCLGGVLHTGSDLDISGLSSGMYIITLEHQDIVYRGTFIKQ